MLHFAEIKVLASSSFENIKNIQASSFKVRGCVVRLRNEKLVTSSVITRLELIADLKIIE